jgi:HAD superfamily hydrolase (TIGR01549 family)
LPDVTDPAPDSDAGHSGTSDSAAADTAIFDVDGTLVDSNYQHALAWFRAFRRYDISLPLWQLHRGIGMGGDLYVSHLAGDRVEREHGDDLREAWVEEFDTMIDEIRPFAGTKALLAEVKKRGFRLVLASSGKSRHVETFLDLFGGRELADAWTTSDDAEISKPAPDIVQAALDRVRGAAGVMIGDSTWDCIAAGKLDVPTLAVRTGGFSTEELGEAGAVGVYDSLEKLLSDLDNTPLRAAVSPG